MLLCWELCPYYTDWVVRLTLLMLYKCQVDSTWFSEKKLAGLQWFILPYSIYHICSCTFHLCRIIRFRVEKLNGSEEKCTQLQPRVEQEKLNGWGCSCYSFATSSLFLGTTTIYHIYPKYQVEFNFSMHFFAFIAYYWKWKKKSRVLRFSPLFGCKSWAVLVCILECVKTVVDGGEVERGMMWKLKESIYFLYFYFYYYY